MQKYIIIFLLTPLFTHPGKNKISPAPTANVYRLFVDTEYLPQEIGDSSLENAMLRGDEKMYFDLRQGGLNPTNDDWVSILKYQVFQERALLVKAYNVLRISPDLIIPTGLADYLCDCVHFKNGCRQFLNKQNKPIELPRKNNLSLATNELQYFYMGARYGLPRYLKQYIIERLWMQTSQGNYSISKKLRGWYLDCCSNNKIMP